MTDEQINKAIAETSNVRRASRQKAMNTSKTQREAVVLNRLVSDLKSRCNRHANGECMSLVCLYNGGYEHGTKPDYNLATCEVHEQVVALESLIAETDATIAEAENRLDEIHISESMK